MEKRVIKVENRQLNTKHSVREMRRAGYVPGVFYGPSVGNVPIKVFQKDLTRMGGSHLMEVVLPQGAYPAVVREVQRGPLSGEIRHVDFQEVDLNQKIRTEVPVQVVGNPHGVAQGGTVQLGERIVHVEAFPREIPDFLAADITNLEIGDKYTVADLQKTVELKIISGLDSVIAVVTVPRVEETEEPGEEEEMEKTPALEEESGENA